MSNNGLGETKFLPGLVYLEMARAAGVFATDTPVSGLKNMVWGPPIGINGRSQCISVSIHKKDTDIYYDITTEEKQKITHHFGEIILKSSNGSITDAIDVDAVRLRLQQNRENLDFKDLMDQWCQNSLVSIETIDEVCWSDTELIATLKLPTRLDNSLRDMPIQPIFINAAWQLVEFFAQYNRIGPLDKGKGNPLLPFFLKRLRVYESPPEQVFVHLLRKVIEEKSNAKCNVSLFDLKGKPYLHLEGFVGKRMNNLMGVKL